MSERLRREPPPFRRVEVARSTVVTQRLQRVTLTGAELQGFDPGLPAASVRLLLPPAGSSDLVLPTWNGNEFLLADGARPTIRTLTPLDFDERRLELDVEVVLHGEGALSRWAADAAPGSPAALSGPGRGYVIDPDAEDFLFAGDESAIPAIETLLARTPAHASVRVAVELANPDVTAPLPDHPGSDVTWLDPIAGGSTGDSLLRWLAASPIADGTQIWVAGEAAAVHRIRQQLFGERGVPRAQAVVRGYWKHGRAGTGTDA